VVGRFDFGERRCDDRLREMRDFVRDAQVHAEGAKIAGRFN
jgi:hypothetical protein